MGISGNLVNKAFSLLSREDFHLMFQIWHLMFLSGFVWPTQYFLSKMELIPTGEI